MNNGRPVLEGPLPVRQDPNGFVFVDIPENALYAVRLINNSPADAGVALSIDGINMFEFSKNEKWKDLGKVVISKAGPDGPGKGLILGWHDDGSASMHFHVTKIGKSAAALLGRTEKVGIITATFCGAFEDEQAVPQLQRLLAGGDRGEVATGFGPLVTQQYKQERRVFGVPQATVSLRYTIPDAPPGG